MIRQHTACIYLLEHYRKMFMVNMLLVKNLKKNSMPGFSLKYYHNNKKKKKKI